MNAARWYSAVERFSSVAVMPLAAAVIWMHIAPKRAVSHIAVPKAPIVIADAATIGNNTAPLMMLVFVDFECEYSKRFFDETWPAIKESYVTTAKVQVAVKHLPLPNHPLASAAAEASVCASQQSRFWPFHDHLFRRTLDLTPETLASAAAGLSLDMQDWSDCLASGFAKKRVDRDTAQAQELGIDATPVFLIGRVRSDGRLKVETVIDGALPLHAFASAFDRASQ